VKIKTRSPRSRKALEETEEGSEIDVDVRCAETLRVEEQN
jgi:hypothetical protein